jgi:hypothetical protein
VKRVSPQLLLGSGGWFGGLVFDDEGDVGVKDVEAVILGFVVVVVESALRRL